MKSSWEGGVRIAEKVRAGAFMGRSGWVALDATGQRSSFTLAVSQLVGGRTFALGTWHPEVGLLRAERRQELRTAGTAAAAAGGPPESGGPRTLVVTTLLSDPYVMKAEKKQAGGLAYEGFAIDLIQEVARIVGFNFSLILAGGYGSRNREDGTWSGMIGDVVGGRADLAVGDLTINSEREAAVDFSMPFLDLGISILFVATPSKSIELFSFMDPLSPLVWVLMLVAGLLVSLTMFLLARFSPFETAELDSREGRSPFLMFRHCLWFSLSCWVQQVQYTAYSCNSLDLSLNLLPIES